MVEKGNVELNNGTGHFVATFDKENGIIRLVRIGTDGDRDTVTVPYALDIDSVLSDLIPKNELLENPYEAPASPDVDGKWKNLSLNTFGIRWERPTSSV